MPDRSSLWNGNGTKLGAFSVGSKESLHWKELEGEGGEKPRQISAFAKRYVSAHRLREPLPGSVPTTELACGRMGFFFVFVNRVIWPRTVERRTPSTKETSNSVGAMRRFRPAKRS